MRSDPFSRDRNKRICALQQAGTISRTDDKRKGLIMSTKTINSALDFMPAPQKPTNVLGFLDIVAKGFVEGLEAANTYKTSTARGVPTEQAARRAMAKIAGR